MAYETIRVRKVTPHVGAVIEGVDLAQPLGNQQFQEIHDALMENLVIFFRDQRITPDQHKAFGRLFGELHMHPTAPRNLPEHPEILVIHADANSKHVAGEEWHSDVSCEEEPPLGSILHMTELPPDGGGNTLFASGYAAYEALSEPLKRMLEGMTAIHDGRQVYEGRFGYKAGDKGYPRAEHPVIATHPVTGRKLLFVNRNFTTRIVQLSKLESDSILEMLYRQIETPEFQCRFAWEPYSIAFWDNRCAQHHAMWDYYPHGRHGHRVTIKGSRPFYRA